MTETPARLRLDKWLWQARFFKTRSLSAKTITSGHCRVNGTHVAKPAFAIAPGDVLVFPQGRAIRTVRVLALGTRRGPAPEAQGLYDDLSPPPPPEPAPAAPAFDKGGRPTKKDRRRLDQTRALPLE